MKKITFTDSNGKKWTHYIIKQVKIGKDEYRVGYYHFNPYKTEDKKSKEFSIVLDKISGVAFDYSKTFSTYDYPQMILAAVIGSFQKTDYFFLIGEILKGRGMGSTGDANLCFDEETNEWEFYFDYNDEVAKNVSRINYADGIKFFYVFFNAFKEYVEKEDPEFMQKKLPSLTVDVEVWPRFLEQLEHLNKLYAELVAKGEIKE